MMLRHLTVALIEVIVHVKSDNDNSEKRNCETKAEFEYYLSKQFGLIQSEIRNPQKMLLCGLHINDCYFSAAPHLKATVF